MKKIILVIYSLIFVFNVNSQNSLGKMDDFQRISLTVVNNNQVEGLSDISRNALNNKINSALLKSNLGSASRGRFIIVPNLVLISKDITPTAPPKYVYNIEVNLYVGDGFDGKLFSHTSFNIKGVADSDTKAYMDAVKKISADDAKFVKLFDEGKKKIIEYYNGACDMIISDAKAEASSDNFDYALYKLSTIPDACLECRTKAQQAITAVYKQKIDFNCREHLLKAKATWQNGLNRTTANEASVYLSKINPNSMCYQEAFGLAEEISKRVFELDKREWEFKMKKQNDEAELQKSVINAIRDIGVAYGENQPKEITSYNYVLWW